MDFTIPTPLALKAEFWPWQLERVKQAGQASKPNRNVTNKRTLE